MIFFVGIGGIGMSGLARLLNAEGREVMGSDSTETDLTKELEDEGIPVKIGHGALPEAVDMLIYSEAIAEDNPERAWARENDIEETSYFEALADVAKDYKLIAIAGTHGKTTTTAMLALIMVHAGLDPTVLVGTKVREFGNSNFRAGKSEYFVVEACEYRRNFRFLKPHILAVTNMEFDHMDYFNDLEDYRKSFKELASKSKEVFWPDDYEIYDGELGVPGKYNNMNAGLAAELARAIGIDDEKISESLSAFSGTWRRFEMRGEVNGAQIIDDYAHHPTEIIACLNGVKERFPGKRIVVVFEPHQYSRTIGLLDEFTEAFSDADEVIVPSIYEVRDSYEDLAKMSPEKLVAKISVHHQNAKFIDGYEKTADYLMAQLSDSDILLVMGAGPVDTVIRFLV